MKMPTFLIFPGAAPSQKLEQGPHDVFNDQNTNRKKETSHKKVPVFKSLYYRGKGIGRKSINGKHPNIGCSL